MARKAKFGDIPQIAELLEEGARRSKYNDRAEFDVAVCKGLLVQSMQRHGAQVAGGTCVFVTEQDGAIDGVIVGMLDRVYHAFNKLYATDMAFYVSPDGSARSAGRLLDAFLDWSDGIEDVIDTQMGATDIIQEYKLAAALYRRKGMKQVGVIYERRMDK